MTAPINLRYRVLNLLDLSTPDVLTDAYFNYRPRNENRLLNSVLNSAKPD
jgi:hypothetical protein